MQLAKENQIAPVASTITYMEIRGGFSGQFIFPPLHTYSAHPHSYRSLKNGQLSVTIVNLPLVLSACVVRLYFMLVFSGCTVLIYCPRLCCLPVLSIFTICSYCLPEMSSCVSHLYCPHLLSPFYCLPVLST